MTTHVKLWLYSTLGVLALCRASSVAAGPVPGTVLWTYDAGSAISASPALSQDGTAYITVGNGLLAVTNSSTGASNRWKFISSLSNPLGAPSVSTDGTVYVSGGNLYALSPDGSQKWVRQQIGSACPAIGSDGTIYAQGSSCLYAISPDGIVKWQGGAGGSVTFCSAAIGPSGSIYIASPNLYTFYGLDAAGAKKWEFPWPPGMVPAESPAVGAQEGTWTLAGGGFLYAFAPAGGCLWTNDSAMNPGTAPASSVAIGTGGTIYFAAIRSFAPLGYGFTFSAISTQGTVQWQLVTNMLGLAGVPLGTPAIDAGGTVYLAAFNTLFALAPTGRILWAFTQGSSPRDPSTYTFTSPTVGPDGTIYCTFGSHLYALSSGTNGAADSPWPMYRHDARHTGSIQRAVLRDAKRRADSNFQFRLYPQQLGLTYTLEASTNLSTWNSLTSVVAETFPVDIIDSGATNYPFRFYRAFSVP